MAGMFKIVQTIEKDLKQLTIVPAAWVQSNQLSWPKKGADKLIRNGNSIPEGNWFTMVCKLKRNHLISYEIAEEELERMLENEDTEQEEIMQTKKRPRLMLPKTKPSQNDFNSLADECLETLQKSAESPAVATQVIDYVIPQSDTENLTYQIIPNDGNFSSIFGTQPITSSLDPQLNEKLDKIIANQDIIIQNQQVIIDNFEHSAGEENQLKIMQHLAKLEVMLDSMASNNSINNICSCKTANQNSLLTTKEDIFFDPIDTVVELEKLEAKLSNKTDMEDYVQKFSYVCGRKGSGNGISNCYILVDKIFSRKFITLCSWAGGARDGKEKIPFKIFKNIISLFFRVVRLSDDDFTLKNCEEFFKAVIRNSTKRNESSLSRSSRSKRRPSSLSYKTRKGKKEIQENNNIVADEGNQGNSHEEETRSNNDNIDENYDAASEVSGEEEEEGK